MQLPKHVRSKHVRLMHVPMQDPWQVNRQLPKHVRSMHVPMQDPWQVNRQLLKHDPWHDAKHDGTGLGTWSPKTVPLFSSDGVVSKVSTVRASRSSLSFPMMFLRKKRENGARLPE